MENHDILKLQTYYDYNFETIESDEFLKTFCKFLSDKNVNEDSNEKARDKKSKFHENFNSTNSLNEKNKESIDSFLSQIDDISFNKSKIFELFKNQGSVFKNLIFELRNFAFKLSCNPPIIRFTFYNYFKSSLNLNTNLHPIQTTGDGNCLYNAFSILLFENENKWHIIKSCMLYQMFKHKEFFQEIMNSLHYNENVDIAIQRAARSREYGNEINILALAILFQRDIIVYIASTKTNQINQVIYSLNIKNKNENPCLLGLVNEHFFPILVEKTLIPQQERIINKNYFLAGREIILEKYFHKF
jgi:hypothetical protein